MTKVYLTDDTTTTIDESVVLIENMPSNEPVALTAIVYLDGEKITNADVANGLESMSGTLNLQFASSEKLFPMENTALREMETEASTTGSGSTTESESSSEAESSSEDETP